MTLSSPQTSRDLVIEKIRKLSAMTQANGASESEAAFAAKKMAEYIDLYNIQTTELEIRQDAKGCIIDSFTATMGLDIWTHACWNIGLLFKCKTWRQHSAFALDEDLLIDQTEMKFYGFKQDVTAAISLCQIIYMAVERSSFAFAKSLPKGQRRANAAAKESFSIGMAQRLNERVKELIPASSPSLGKGLMVLKDQLVTEQFADYCRAHGLSFRSAGRLSISDQGAYSAGRTAGGNVNLTQNSSLSRSHYHLSRS